MCSEEVNTNRVAGVIKELSMTATVGELEDLWTPHVEIKREGETKMRMDILEKSLGCRVVDAKGAAAFLGIGESTFWKWVSQGDIPKGVKLNARRTLWKETDLQEFLDRKASELAAAFERRA